MSVREAISWLKSINALQLNLIFRQLIISVECYYKEGKKRKEKKLNMEISEMIKME